MGALVYQNCNLVIFWRTGQLIAFEVKAHQLGQLPNLGRDGACQRIFGHKTISGRLENQSINLSKKGFPVNSLKSSEIELRHSRAPPELRRNVVCAARRSFQVLGTLVYQARHCEQKTRAPVNLLARRLSTLIALQHPSSVGIRPVQYSIECFVSRRFTRTRTPIDQSEQKSAHRSIVCSLDGGRFAKRVHAWSCTERTSELAASQIQHA